MNSSGSKSIKRRLMNIKELTDQSTWTTFFEKCGSPSFHQSWEWGELQLKNGYPIVRLGIYNKNQLETIALVIKSRARRGNFLFVPHGPVIKATNHTLLETYLSLLTTFLKDLAKTEGFTFIRIAPNELNTPENKKIFELIGYRKAPIYIHAERMWALDITKSEDELLAGMRKTTRYLIRKAIKDGITIDKLQNESCVKDFWEIYKETFTREHFSPYSQHFITEEFKAFHNTNNALFLFGKKPQKFAQEGTSADMTSTSLPYLAGALVLFTESTAFYHQGASIHTKLPVPYLLQWEAIKEAKKRGCKIYNFYGIVHPGRTPKAWAGLTLFKQGFGGYELDYLPTQDLIISPKYYLSFLYEKYLNFRRGV